MSLTVAVVHAASRFAMALNAASYQLNIPVVEYLLQHMQQEEINASGAHYGNAIQSMLRGARKDWDRSLELLEILLKAGTPASVDRHGTALHTAASSYSKPLIKRILEASSGSADEKDGGGRFPIHLAALNFWRPSTATETR